MFYHSGNLTEEAPIKKNDLFSVITFKSYGEKAKVWRSTACISWLCVSVFLSCAKIWYVWIILMKIFKQIQLQKEDIEKWCVCYFVLWMCTISFIHWNLAIMFREWLIMRIQSLWRLGPFCRVWVKLALVPSFANVFHLQLEATMFISSSECDKKASSCKQGPGLYQAPNLKELWS